jgi:hypothetical protein
MLSLLQLRLRLRWMFVERRWLSCGSVAAAFLGHRITESNPHPCRISHQHSIAEVPRDL